MEHISSEIKEFTEDFGGHDKSCMTLILDGERFFKKAPIGDPTKLLRGGTGQGPDLRPLLMSYISDCLTRSARATVDGQLGDILDILGPSYPIGAPNSI